MRNLRKVAQKRAFSATWFRQGLRDGMIEDHTYLDEADIKDLIIHTDHGKEVVFGGMVHEPKRTATFSISPAFLSAGSRYKPTIVISVSSY